MKYLILSTVIRAFCLLPLRFIRALALPIARIACVFRPEFVKVTLRNIELCYPHKSQAEREQLVRRSIVETIKVSLEVFLVWQRDTTWLQTHLLEVNNEDLIQNALKEDKGLVILAPHMGNWEVLGKILPQYANIMSLYAPPKQDVLERFVKESRESSGATLVPTNARGIAKLMRHLKGGGLTGILPDQVPPKSGGDYAKFFGVSALTMTLVHGLISRTDCKVLLAVALRVKGGFHIHFLQADPLIYSKNLEESLLGLNLSVERAISFAPEQWQWEYKRFKRQASKSTSYYDF